MCTSAPQTTVNNVSRDAKDTCLRLFICPTTLISSVWMIAEEQGCGRGYQAYGISFQLHPLSGSAYGDRRESLQCH